MKYFRVSFHRDEIRKFEKRGFKPFVVEFVKSTYDAPFELSKGQTIVDWPATVELRSCQDGQLLTRLSNDSHMYLFSRDAINLFEEHAIKGFQYLPVAIYKEDGSVLSEYQLVANIPNQVPCFDLEKSRYDLYSADLRPDLVGQVSLIHKMVLREDKLKDVELDVFRLAEQYIEVIVSERFVRLWTESKYSNLAFDEVELS